MLTAGIRAARRRARALRRDRGGAVTVEFMLALTPFLILLLGIIEIGLLAFSGATLRNGTYEAARITRTNSQGCLTQAQIEAIICDNALFAPACDSRLEATRRVLANGWGSDADDLTGGAPVDDDSAAGGDVVLVTATYEWQTISPLISSIIGDENGEISLTQRFVFQNEPFAGTSCPIS